MTIETEMLGFDADGNSHAVFALGHCDERQIGHWKEEHHSASLIRPVGQKMTGALRLNRMLKLER